jgi:hypothetical protein
MSACCDWALALKPKNNTIVVTLTERHIPFFIAFPSLKIGGDVERVSRIMHSMTTSDSTFYSINTRKFVRFGSKADIARCQAHVRFTPKSGHCLIANCSSKFWHRKLVERPGAGFI